MAGVWTRRLVSLISILAGNPAEGRSTDCSQVDVLGVRNKSVNLAAGKSLAHHIGGPK